MFWPKLSKFKLSNTSSSQNKPVVCCGGHTSITLWGVSQHHNPAPPVEDALHHIVGSLVGLGSQIRSSHRGVTSGSGLTTPDCSWLLTKFNATPILCTFHGHRRLACQRDGQTGTPPSWHLCSVKRGSTGMSKLTTHPANNMLFSTIPCPPHVCLSILWVQL